MPLGVRVFARPMRYCSLARRTLSRLSLSLSSGVMARSWMVCAGLQKCSATPDLSSLLLIMSRRCSLNLSLSRLLVCPMYWQFLFPLCRNSLSPLTYHPYTPTSLTQKVSKLPGYTSTNAPPKLPPQKLFATSSTLY